MASPYPYFYFYPQSWLVNSGIRVLPLAGRGLLANLLAIQWEDGVIPDDPRLVAKVIGQPVRQVRALWPAIRSLLVETEEGLIDGQMAKQRAKAMAKADRNRLPGWAQGNTPKSRRRIRQREAGGVIPRWVREMVLDRDGRACRRCEATSDLTIDHIKPISRGGSNCPSNLQILCRPCNSRKRDKEETGG